MTLKGVLELLDRHPEHRGNVDASGATVRQGARSAFLASLWRRQRGPLLVITPRPDDARRLHDQLLTYLGEDQPIHLLPEPEVLPYERLAVDANTGNQRLTALAALAGAGRFGASEPDVLPLVICSVGSALLYTLPPELMAGVFPATGALSLWKKGDRIRIETVLGQWLDLGYHNEPVVEAPGSFSHRGGILDVFPTGSEWPLRIELWDDEIDTIRYFDPVSQRSIRPADEVRLAPAREQLPGLAHQQTMESSIEALDYAKCGNEVRDRMAEELSVLSSEPNPETLSFYNGLVNQAHLMEYIGANGLVVLERYGRVEAEALELEERFERMREAREDRGELPVNFPSPHMDWEEFSNRLSGLPQMQLQTWVGDDEDKIFRPSTPYYGKLEQLAADVRRHQEANYAVVAVTQHQRRVAEILEQEGVGVTQADSLESAPTAGQVVLLPGYLRDGWTIHLPAGGENGEVTTLVLLTDSELFGTVKEQRYHRRRKAEHGPEVVLADLVPGAHVVHIDHGVAKFAGTTRIGDDEDEKEYLILEYAENDKLYVPTDHLDRVSAYVGAQDQPPSLTRLSTAEWARVKSRVKGATREMAQELLRINAARAIAEGHEHGSDTVWQQELEDSFPFIETPDQARAIVEVKADMETTRPMDRLICGDVGYGKTEIALRAAFKSVNDGLQVAMLVPTTVLAQQHYATFSERLSPFPVKIEVLSRFRTPKEQQEVIEGLKDGSVDIVIGTHRLLQKDVRFKNLGLAVVDEEQRFGVSHKERLKQLRQQVDVLTLSATPIPRTLNMALAGIRDLSTMDSAPEARLPVKTFVSEYSEDVIKEAILREMERGGQVFYLHNRVRTINQAAAEINKLVPQARIMVGHGQMAETELEDVMVGFANGDADILVCTTIIESGLDMPNVNTLILERADRFGLAQLYQLRGRVGRSEHRAYAYLLVPRGRRITEAADHRLQAILEASELGAGFRIAMRDLEIRGAGNILGASQSGHIQEVGLDLYTQLLNEAVRELEEEGGSSDGVEIPPELPRIELPMDARIPEDYVDHLPTRLAVYQRLAKMSDADYIPEIREELRDRFGPLPEEVENLLTLVSLRTLAADVGVESIVQGNDAIVLSLRVPVGGARVPLQRALGPSVQVGNTQMQMPLRRLGDEWLSRLTRVLERFLVFQENLTVLAGQASAD
ncbi:MAG: transcription-repair coupling factor [SAR202 cluster bacterium]|nr:transcription-repair coupling factor [SAR202 cluster bacterium]MQG77870.1 transcription-repair coupling factor [SAR202 cluster bacterium]|tara:strand:- start:2258 stop:5797 length:3540 start_codon:yes stop_codon:yes gene_type:complete